VALALFPSFSNLLCTAHAFHYLYPQYHTLSTLCPSLVLDVSLDIFVSLMDPLASVVREVAHYNEDDTDEDNSTVDEFSNDNRYSKA
jgi:hypothetical protein